VIAGIFVGGESRRMGGRPKGLLPAPADANGSRSSIVLRTRELAREQCDEVVLVGSAEAYAGLGVSAISDATTSAGGARQGPLAGLVALLERARDGPVIALACDMPYLASSVLARLATFAPGAAAVAPREDGVWSPLFARYDAARVAPVARAKLEAGERSLWRVLQEVDAQELPLSPDERATLRDWDEPNDIDAEPE
jgi:molybdopterin-guanine dinucleotide biosynthesis protein A